MTVTSTAPAACAGAVAVNCVADTNVTAGDAVLPKLTIAPGTKPVPLTVTMFPPAVEPAFGTTLLTVGGPYAYKAPFTAALVPPAVVTVTPTTPAGCAGAVAVNRVADTNVTDTAAVGPNFTLAPETKFVPLIVTDVPPAVEPAFGTKPLTAGADSNV